MNQIDSTIFKAYDIRGIYPAQLNEELAYKIGQAYAKFVNPKTVALGRDVRVSGPALFEAVKKGLMDHGVNVIDIGIITTDMYYFASGEYELDAIIISASHNPREYNGMKMVRKNAVPISGDTGLQDIRDIVLSGYEFKASEPGKSEVKDIRAAYLAKCLSFVEINKIKNFKVVANAMFGLAVQNVLKLNLPVQIVPLNEVPDGTFPKGAPDPFLKENRTEIEELIRSSGADMGVAWDGDADRFFLFDETGRYIPGYYLSAFLANYFCQKSPGTKIIYDPRNTWAIIDSVNAAGGQSLLNKVGHSFIKERMRSEDAVFAGEGSGHYYFRDFYYADNGLIPLLIVLQVVSESGKKVSELFNEYFDKYHISGEINTELQSIDQVVQTLKRMEERFKDVPIDRTDGVSIEDSQWRANVRSSNTQPLIRLNVEAKDPEVLQQKTQELLDLIQK